LAGIVIQNQDWRRDEMDILRKYVHQNIVKYVDEAFDMKEVPLVTELLSSSLYDALRLEKKSLYTVIHTSKGVRVNQSQFQPRLTDLETFNILDGSFEGLRYLHNIPIRQLAYHICCHPAKFPALFSHHFRAPLIKRR
jgi:hypothetical protein